MKSVGKPWMSLEALTAGVDNSKRWARNNTGATIQKTVTKLTVFGERWAR